MGVDRESESSSSSEEEEMEGETSGGAIECGADFNSLPEGCIANILSLTTPRDACRSAAVSPLFRLAADSDAVWERFLPPDHQSIISRAVDPSPLQLLPRKKDLYIGLHDRPVLIDNGTKSFSVDKLSGKKCFMLSARSLHIVWGDTPTYWKWTSKPESRFESVAELLSVCWLDIRGMINTNLLSPSTNYAAYLIYKLTSEAYGFDYHPTEVSVKLVFGEESEEISKSTVCLEPAPEDQRQQTPYLPRRFWIFGQNRMDGLQRPQQRSNDGWLEVELGEYYNNGGEDGELEMSVLEVKGGNWKNGLVVEGIEIRPKVKEVEMG